MPDLDERLHGIENVSVPDQWEEIRDRMTRTPPARSGRTPAVVVGAIVGAAAIGLGLFVALGLRGTKPAAGAHSNGVIVFEHGAPKTPGLYRFENEDLFAYDPASGRIVNLTGTPGVAETGAVWSPDGSKVVYQRLLGHRNGAAPPEWDLVLAEANDLAHARVIRACPQFGGCVFDAAWSPDGSQVAWVAEEHVGGGYTMKLEIFDLGSSRTTIACDYQICGTPGQLAWSPDGARIVFSQASRGRFEHGLFVPAGPIRVVDVATGRVHGVTDADDRCDLRHIDRCVYDSAPAWSPDGSSILFVHAVGVGRPGGRVSVMEANADGSAPHALATCRSMNECFQGPVVWSPDGRRIAWIDRYDRSRLHLVDVTGVAEVIPLPPRAQESYGFLTWSPDGKQLAFFGSGKHPVLFVVDARQLTIGKIASVASNGEATWLPAGAITLPPETASP